MSAVAFISYSHADEKALEKLHKHLSILKRDGELLAWTDHEILAGDKVDVSISRQLEICDLFIALISPDYLASNYCYETEFGRAQERALSGELRIVPVILEPCDWLASPFKEFLALPKEGRPVSNFTNVNNAFLDIVTGIRRIIESGNCEKQNSIDEKKSPISRQVRIKKDFDAIQRADYADRAFDVLHDYFKSSCVELSRASEDLRTKFEDMSPTAFTCSVVNRSKYNEEAHITVHNSKGNISGFGSISYINRRYAEKNMANGWIRVANDDYQLFLKMDHFSGNRDDEKITPEQVAERLWNDFVRQAGIEYE
ncbi:toll/interleukin-1 receptor domain-containing protein [Acetobacter sp. DmW_136]|uniref:toll/interleukin-1 receptor domain-containing protein n=1 Tax=Acetobacter sp. DmW_136 TaxID=2591091 RepID=UPI00123AC3B2|nr:toll/interleukin-1 receptor domain-containing protein [Acetobacter sp. DmW_136]KAA8388526.1 toll/interleukin-1 receptor domain-containing protein [Acetobacter sp. DmW_136]